jgi:hypothetical protein
MFRLKLGPGQTLPAKGGQFKTANTGQFMRFLQSIAYHAHGIILSQTLSPLALYYITFGWFEAPSCKVT